jgi:hypothetical protein
MSLYHPIFLNEDEYGRYSVIDGKQRLSAITNFLSNNLVLQGLESYFQISMVANLTICRADCGPLFAHPTLRAIIILRQSDSDLKNEVFHRLNTGGQHLNPQEIRNNAYHGTLNDLIMELSEHRSFHSTLGIKNKYRSKIYQEMRDAEFVLRFLTFKDDWDTFAGGIRRRMDSFMASNRNPDEAILANFRQSFLATLTSVTTIFGDHSFHRWVPAREAWRHQALAALFDAQMLACQYYTRERLRPYAERIVFRFKELFKDDGFRRSIDAATNTPSYFRDRVTRLKQLIDECLPPE